MIMMEEDALSGPGVTAGVALSPYPAELAAKVGELNLTVRANNVLSLAGVECVGDLVQLTEQQIADFQNCGERTIRELREALAERGLTLGMRLDAQNNPIQTEPSSTSTTVAVVKTMNNLDDATRLKLYLRIDEVGLFPRTRNALRAAKIIYFGDLVGNSEKDLLRVRSFGRLSLSEIKAKLNELGLTLGYRIADWSAKDAKELRKRQDADMNSPIARLRRSIASVPSAAFLEDELEAIFSSVANDRDTEIAMKQLGWSGKGHRTLESVAQEYGITRERIRQVVTRKYGEIRKKFVGAPLLDDALDVVRDRCPATAEQLGAELHAQGITRENFDPSGLETACEVLQRDFGLERLHVGDKKVFLPADTVSIAVEFFRLCRRLTSSRGCANFDALCDELRIAEGKRDRYRELATIDSLCEWLDSDRSWLFTTGLTRNRLSNLASKVLSIAPELPLSEMRKALARSRRLAVVPPAHVLASFLKRFGLATVVDNVARAAPDFIGVIRPTSTEAVMASVLKAHGPILGWERFQELCVAEGMNPITFGIYLSASPIIARIARGIYGLVGADVPPGAVEDLEREIVSARKSAEWGWTARGTLWYAMPITGASLAVGSVPLPQFVADICDGEWQPRFDGRELDGSLKCSNRFLWGLRRPLVNAGAEPGDFAILEFDLSRREVKVAIGTEETVDMWESGDIELPSLENQETEPAEDVEEALLQNYD